MLAMEEVPLDALGSRRSQTGECGRASTSGDPISVQAVRTIVPSPAAATVSFQNSTCLGLLGRMGLQGAPSMPAHAA